MLRIQTVHSVQFSVLEITKAFDDKLEDDTFKIICNGSGGQSFWCFHSKGLT